MKPVHDLRGFVGGLQKHFGWQLLAILFVSQHISKGFVRDFTGAASTYIMKECAGEFEPQRQWASRVLPRTDCTK